MSEGLIGAFLAFLLALLGLSLNEATQDQPRPQSQPSFEFHKPDFRTDDFRDVLRGFREDLMDALEQKQHDLRNRTDALTPDENNGATSEDSAQECTRDERSGEGWLSTLIRCHSSSSSSDGTTSTSNSIVVTSSSSSSGGFNVDSTKR